MSLDESIDFPWSAIESLQRVGEDISKERCNFIGGLRFILHKEEYSFESFELEVNRIDGGMKGFKHKSRFSRKEGVLIQYGFKEKSEIPEITYLSNNRLLLFRQLFRVNHSFYPSRRMGEHFLYSHENVKSIECTDISMHFNPEDLHVEDLEKLRAQSFTEFEMLHEERSELREESSVHWLTCVLHKPLT